MKPETIETLRQLWQKNTPTRQIAREIGVSQSYVQRKANQLIADGRLRSRPRHPGGLAISRDKVETIRLRYLDGVPTKMIARELGVSIQCVYGQVERMIARGEAPPRTRNIHEASYRREKLAQELKEKNCTAAGEAVESR